MKKVLFSMFALAMTTAAFAQDQVAPAAAEAPVAAAAPAQAPVASAAVAEQDSKTKVEAANLPEGVKKTLASDKYKDWSVDSAWLVKGAKEYYELQMKKGEEVTSLKLDKDGNLIG
jgi:hypothetical protein